MAKVQLGSAGTLEITLQDVDLFELSIEDREFVFGLADAVKQFEGDRFRALNPPPEEPIPQPPALPSGVSDQNISNIIPAETTNLVSNDEVVAAPSDVASPSPKSEVGDVPETRTPKSGMNLVLEFIKAGTGPVSLASIREELAAHGLGESTASDYTYRLKNQGMVRSLGKGLWALAESPQEPEPSGNKPLSVVIDEHTTALPDQETHGEGLEGGSLGQLLQEIRSHEPQRPIDEPDSFQQPWRMSVAEESAARAEKHLEEKHAEVADALPLAVGPCKWHAGGCGNAAQRLVPSYSGGRLIETFKLCRHHCLIKIGSDHLTHIRATMFADLKVG